MKVVGFDIETIPQQKTLSRAQKEWLDNKLEYALEKGPSYETKEETERRVMATTPYLGEIVCIGIGEITEKTIRTEAFIGSEKELLKSFWAAISKVPSGLFVSFNGLKFDVNFIVMRSLYHKILPTNKNFLNTSKFRKFPHFDVMAWMADWGYPSPTLDIACDITGVKSSKEGEIKAKDVAQAFYKGKIDEIAEYCEEDVRATLEIYLQLKNYVRD